MEIQYGNVVVRIDEREAINPTMLEKCFIQSVVRIVFERHKKQVQEIIDSYKRVIENQNIIIKDIKDVSDFYKEKYEKLKKKRFFIF